MTEHLCCQFSRHRGLLNKFKLNINLEIKKEIRNTVSATTTNDL